MCIFKNGKLPSVLKFSSTVEQLLGMGWFAFFHVDPLWPLGELQDQSRGGEARLSQKLGARGLPPGLASLPLLHRPSLVRDPQSQVSGCPAASSPRLGCGPSLLWVHLPTCERTAGAPAGCGPQRPSRHGGEHGPQSSPEHALGRPVGALAHRKLPHVVTHLCFLQRGLLPGSSRALLTPHSCDA